MFACMKRIILTISILFLIKLVFAQKFTPPDAKKSDTVRVLHGDTTIDSYHWMSDKHNVDFINYLYAENAYADRVMKSSKLLQKKLYEEYKAMIKHTDKSEPYKKDNYWYYQRIEKGQDYPLYCRKKDSLTAEEEIVFNGPEMAKEYMYFSLSTYSVSPNHKLLAYGINNTGDDNGMLFIKDIEKDSIILDKIENVADFTWVNNKLFIYILENKKSKRANTVLRHTLGTDYKKDSILYQEKDKHYFLSLGRTSSKEYILLNRSTFTENEILYFPANKPYSLFKLFKKVEKNKEYGIRHIEEEPYFYITTDIPSSKKALYRTPENKPGFDNMEPVIIPADTLEYRYTKIYRDYFVSTYSYGPVSFLEIKNRKKNETKLIYPEQDNDILYMSKTYKYDSLYFEYDIQNMKTPATTKRYFLETGKDSIIKKDTLVFEYNPDDFITERLWATAPDSSKVPIDILYKKGLEKNGKNPLYLYAYACYGNNQMPYFSKKAYLFANRGFVYAIAHPRGESFMGKHWHDDGKMLNKKNTYTDFIACTEHLIKENYTNSQKIAIEGGSAGGMLMGAVTTMRPDLFKCVIPNVPFVDVLYQMQDTSWSNIIGHFKELGNPQIKEHYFSMKEWCPYQNTIPQNYPDMLVLSGYNDSRVPVWSPAKWVAKLRDVKQDTNLLLFKTQMSAGHGGRSGRYQGIKDLAFTMAFIFRSLGIDENYITVKGTVVDKFNEPLPFVNIYIDGTTNGTTSNYNGEFSIDLREGTSQKIIFRYVGFEKKVVEVDINTETRDLKVELTAEDNLLPQVIVTTDGEDPAYGIIKQAQENRKKHLNQVESYSTDIYIKGSGRLNEIPEKLPDFLKIEDMPDSNDIGLMSVSESVAKFHFKQPDYYKEEMIASKVSGYKRGYSWNRARSVMMNFYQNIIEMGWYSERGFITPIASQAMMYYKYKLVDVFQEDNKNIYKIKIIPRRKNDPVFRGHIYIAEGSWNYHSFDLKLTKDAQIEMIDSLIIKQSYVENLDSIWMPMTIQFDQHLKIFGFGVTESTIGCFSNYQLNRKFKPDFFNNEVFRIEKDANKRDSSYWEVIRPFVLTSEEEANYHKNDSIEDLHSSKEYRDSVANARNKVTFDDIIFSGVSYHFTGPDIRYYNNALINAVEYNTVEGLVLSYRPNFTIFKKDTSDEYKYWWERDYYRIHTNFKYSITNDEFYGTAAYRKSFRAGDKYLGAYFKAGREIRDYAGVNKLVNSIYTLLYETNYAKFYQKDFIQTSLRTHISRDVYAFANIGYSYRKSRKNATDFTFKDYKNREFISNNPLSPSEDSPDFKPHGLLKTNIYVKVLYDQKYETMPEYKRYLGTKYPTVWFSYENGIYLNGKKGGYDFTSISVSDAIDMGMFGKSVFIVNSGMFLRKKNLEFIDYHHFDANQTIFLNQEWGMGQNVKFNTLNYFDYSTSGGYVAASYEHHFNRWFFNKLPLIRKLKFQAIAGTAALYTQNNGSFTELFLGVENILNFLRVDFVGQYQNNKLAPVIRFGIDFGLF